MGIGWGSRTLLAGLLLLVAGTHPAWADKAADSPRSTDGFGRWESPLSQCQLQWPGRARSGCLKLRLDQSIEGMLRVRFINAATGSRFASEELTFAGLLLKEHQPMQCRQGECKPTWPMRIQVHGVASRRFDGRGLADQLPSNHLAKGNCRLDADQLSCQAEVRGGQSWQASAKLPRPMTTHPSAKP